MSTPHLTGLVALLISANRMSGEPPAELTYDDVYSLLAVSADRDQLAKPDGWGGRGSVFPWKPVRKMCDAKPYTSFPNDFYGYGRINAGLAVAAAAGHFAPLLTLQNA